MFQIGSLRETRVLHLILSFHQLPYLSPFAFSFSGIKLL